MTKSASLFTLISVQAVVSAASLVVEIVAGRLLAPYVGMSLYTWTAIIAVVLAGFSAGHWAGGLAAERGTRRALWLTGWAMLLAAITTAVILHLLQVVAPALIDWIDHPVWAIAAICLAVFFLPSFFAGIPSPVLAQAAVEMSGRQGRALGAMFAAGALGAIAGTLLAGFLFIAWLGSALTLVLVTLTYLVSAGIILAMTSQKKIWGPLGAALLAVALAGTAVSAPSPCSRESRYFCLRKVDISADPDRPVNLMVIDHLAHGISARDLPRIMFTDHAAMLDALARVRMGRREFSSFFIGGGTYSIPRAFADREIGPVTIAEIDPAVTEMAVSDFWYDPTGHRILHEDARVALLRDPGSRYDVIVGDAFTDIAVPAHLITQEFFQLVASRLQDDGVFLMNVIDFEDRMDALASVVRTMKTVFPSVEIWTERASPEKGQRLVFVIAAGTSDSPVSNVTTFNPNRVTYSAMASTWVDSLVSRKGMLLTDDFAPIDRLIGRTD